MLKFQLPFFRELDLLDFEDEEMSGVEFKGIDIILDLHLENPLAVNMEQLEIAKEFLENIGEMDMKNKQYILDEYNDKNGTTVKYYLEFHLGMLWKGILVKLINFYNKEIEPIDQLLQQFHLVRIGLYPENEDVFAIFDYTIGWDYTDYMVVVNINSKGELSHLTMET